MRAVGTTSSGRGGLSVVLLAPANSLHTARWAQALTGAGHRVVVVSWRPGTAWPGVNVRVAPGAGAASARRAAVAALWLRRLIRQYRPDLVHVHSLGTYALFSLALPAGLARVVTPWGSELRAAQRSAARAAFAGLALRRADLVVPTSAEVASHVTSRYRVPAARTRLLSWGVAPELITALPSISAGVVRAALRIPARATVVLSVRTCAATYRTMEIVSAFTAAAADREDLFLVVLGGHRPDREAARRAVGCYGDRVRDAVDAVRNRVLMVDRTLPPRETFELMCASDVAVSVPTADQRSSSVLEAALAGCRLLLSDIAPYREMISDGLVADLAPEPIVAGLATFLRHISAEEASRRTNQRFILTHEHGADKLAELESIYRQLPKGKQRRR